MKLSDILAPTEPTTAITVKIPVSELDALKTIARQNHSNLSAVVRALIKAGLENETVSRETAN